MARPTKNSAPLAEQVYVALRNDLMSGQLDPRQRLGEERLGEIYGVSRTPVREALARLLADGLVQREIDGVYPYRPRVEDLAGLYELRVTLEVRGIDRVLEDDGRGYDLPRVDAELTRWRSLRDDAPAPDAGFVTLDEQFHTTLLAAAGNDALAVALEHVNARVRPVRMFDYTSEQRMSAAVTEHIRLGELVLAGDLEAARAALVTHIVTSRDVVIRQAEQALSLAHMASRVRG
ncbi:GntR family transcriptional regulator [Rhodococcus sp. HNM0569]|uniref:GntR family transcriptional regulator n=1 Tax=Rhodococcus sp. HNM0569 TaxID=2716340 RepID=UPI00146E8F13|nr:GntR family transcriptional regulator [Rhodococcus sp. HNM0569]NLU83099.1 GntR family transcriptional regulator [Rhodococcus sp. HNM0569]